MTDFTASNGIKVENFTHFSGLQRIIVEKNAKREIDVAVTADIVKALVEALDHERDEELGRWRWPENPDYVVYSHPDAAFERMFGPNLDLVILRESDGMTKGYVRDEDQGGPPMDHRVDHILAARAYFEAHPERKPWEDAKPGEVWVLTTGDEDKVPAVASSSDSGVVIFTAATHDAGGTEEIASYSDYITAGRRIWPEDAS